MDSPDLAELLDKTCANALDAWFKGKISAPQEAIGAMKALEDELKRYIKPDYDSDYVPPAYVVKYQLGHIYMAWHVLSRLKDEMSLGTRRAESLRIVDFGAGPSVGRIGAALMAAEAIEDGRSIDRIVVDEIDVSTRMLGMGNLVWRAFTQEAQRNFAESALAQAVKVVKSRQNNDWKNVRKDDCDTWLTAFHVTYGDQDLREIIETLYHQVKPIAGAFSCHRGNLERMREVFHFCRVEEWNSGYYPPHEGKTDGNVTCDTHYTIDRAIHYGFREQSQRDWRPYLQVRDCAILFGDDIPF